jgi:integrator complex subunit 2
MPALAIMLSLDHAGRTLGTDSEGDMVAFVSGLLLGNDQQVRNWFALFVRNGQKVCELNSEKVQQSNKAVIGFTLCKE